MGARLTKARVEGARPSAAGDVFLWDAALPGFGLRVLPSGRRSYLIQYRAKGRTRRLTLGPHGTLTLDQARRRARRLLAGVHEGQDPSEDRHQQRLAATMAELGERYLEQHARPKKKASSAIEDERMFRRRILPALGRRKVEDVTRSDVDRLHAAMKATPIMANRVLFLLSTMMNLAEKWGMRDARTNPCQGVERYREGRRDRFLSEVELARLGEVLRQAEDGYVRGRDPRREASELPSAVAAIRLLIFTGARVSEILTARWEYFDVDRRVLRLPDSKTGAKAIPLNPPTLEILEGLRAERSGPWVVQGDAPGEHLVNLGKAWRRIRKRAGLADVRLHDLRHSFASVGVGAGLSLPLIGALLGHRRTETTQRYAHLADDPVRAASDAIGSRLDAVLSGRPGGSLLSMERRG